MRSRVTPEKITILLKNDVFVFGSNESGIHGGGAARLAADKFGATPGTGFGMQGQSFGIPTKSHGIKRTLTIPEIKKYVDWFISATQIPENAHLTFLVTEIGCGLAGLTPEEVAPLFKKCVPLANVMLPARFWEVLNAVQ
jgi:hypothetical protein